MDIFKDKVFSYLDKKTFGTLLIDDVSGVGKTYNIKKMMTTDSGEFITSKVKYYCYLDANKINDVNIKTYIVENSKNMNSTVNADLYYNLSKLNKNKTYLENIYLFYKIYIEKHISFIKVFTYPIKVFIDIIVSVFFKSSFNVNSFFGGFSKWKDFLYSNFNIDDSIVLVIDDLDKKKNNIHLKDIFSSIVQFQENNDAKIILIINSQLITEQENVFLNDWKKRNTQFTVNFDYDYDNYTKYDNFIYIVKTIKNLPSLYSKLTEELINDIIEKKINLTNYTVLKKIDKFSHELYSIETKLIECYKEKIEFKGVNDVIKEDFLALHHSLILMAFMYLNDMDLVEEKEEYESYGDYETVDKYFKGDHYNLKERLDIVITSYTDDVDRASQFYLAYLNHYPEVKNKIISNKPNIYKFAHSQKKSIYEFFSADLYYPTIFILGFLDQIIASNYSKTFIEREHFKLLDILEKIYEIKNIELNFEWQEMSRINETIYYQTYMISQIKFQYEQCENFIECLSFLRNDIFVKQLRKKINDNFIHFREAIHIQFFSYFSIYDSIDFFDYYVNEMDDVGGIIFHLIDSCIYHNIDLSIGFKKFIDRNPLYMNKEMENIKKIGLNYLSSEINEIQNNIDNKVYIPDLDNVEYSVIKKEKEDRVHLINIFGNLVQIVPNEDYTK